MGVSLGDASSRYLLSRVASLEATLRIVQALRDCLPELCRNRLRLPVRDLGFLGIGISSMKCRGLGKMAEVSAGGVWYIRNVFRVATYCDE